MNELQVFKNSEFGELGVLQINGKEYFPATACAKILGYVNPRKAIIDHCKTEGVTKRDAWVQTGVKADGSPAMRQNEINFINEGNLYRLIVSSKLPSAEKFERWVFDEVLPTIRKQGAYGIPNFEDIILKTATAVATAIVKQLNPQNPETEVANSYRRSSCKIDRLKPYLKTMVEQMLTDGCPYREIVDFLEDNGEKMSQMAVCTYAKKYFTSLEMLNQNASRWQYGSTYRR